MHTLINYYQHLSVRDYIYLSNRIGIYTRDMETELRISLVMWKYVYLLIVRYVERNDSWVELRTLDYENPGSNPVLRC